jgi:hypothetical protein
VIETGAKDGPAHWIGEVAGQVGNLPHNRGAKKNRGVNSRGILVELQLTIM